MAASNSVTRELLPASVIAAEKSNSLPKKQPKIGSFYRVLYRDGPGNYFMTEMQWTKNGWDSVDKVVVDWFPLRERHRPSMPAIFDLELEEDL